MNALVDEYDDFAMYDNIQSNRPNERVIRVFQAVELPKKKSNDQEEERSFMDGSYYFGEWKRDKSHHWVPDGRGIAISYREKLVYFGGIVRGVLRGYGRMVPF